MHVRGRLGLYKTSPGGKKRKEKKSKGLKKQIKSSAVNSVVGCELEHEDNRGKRVTDHAGWQNLAEI